MGAVAGSSAKVKEPLLVMMDTSGFGTLTVLAVLAYPHVSKYRVAVLLCIRGVVIEVLQYWGGFRFGDWQDAVADAVGVLLGLVLYKLIFKRLIN